MGERAVGHELLQRARDFEDGDASAGVVVGTGPLMVEVAGKSDFFLFELGIGARDGAGDDFVVAGMLAGLDNGVETDFFAFGQAFAHGTTCFQRNHEAKCFVRRKRFEMTPAN